MLRQSLFHVELEEALQVILMSVGKKRVAQGTQVCMMNHQDKKT